MTTQPPQKKRAVFLPVPPSLSQSVPVQSVSKTKITDVKRGGFMMKGVVANLDIKAWTLIGIYPSRKISKAYRDMNRLEGKSEEEINELTTYDFEDPEDPEYVLSPVDNEGHILPDFKKATALYVNEASANGEFPNVVMHAKNNNIYFYSYKDIPAGEELLTYYGNEYPRNYDIWWIAHAKEDIATDIIFDVAIESDDDTQESSIDESMKDFIASDDSDIM